MTRPTLGSAILLVLLLAGCKSSSTSSTAPGSNTSSSSSSPTATLPTTFTTAPISDPSFNNILADTMTIPTGWKLDGTMMMAPCTTIPWPVYRAYSTDSLTEMRQYPALGWHWATSGSFNQGGCLGLKSTISASDFLQHFLTTLPDGVNIVGPMPVTPAFSQWAQNFANQQNQATAQITFGPAVSHATADTAALHIQTHNGTYLIDQRLRAVVICTVYPNPGYLQGGTCWGRVDDLRAPQGNLDALVALVDNNNLPNPKEDPQWVQAALARSRQKTQAGANQLFAMQRQAAATFQAMNQQFMQTMQQNFQNFQASQQAKFNNFQANMAQQQQLQSNIASDWVDYALGQQTVAGPGGAPTTVSNDSTMWSNGTQWFQTSDNINPGAGWTKATQVHGNGAPM